MVVSRVKRWCENLGLEVRDMKKKNQRYVEPEKKNGIAVLRKKWLGFRKIV